MALQDTLKVEMSREHWDRVAPVFCVPPHTYNNYQYRVILGLSHFSPTGTVSTSPNLAKEGARSATIITRPSGSRFS